MAENDFDLLAMGALRTSIALDLGSAEFTTGAEASELHDRQPYRFPSHIVPLGNSPE